MARHWQGRNYQVGTRVQYRTGYIMVKTENGMMAEARRMWELHHGELGPGDRVYHIDGDRTNNKIRNLAKITFNATPFVPLKESRILWMPGAKKRLAV